MNLESKLQKTIVVRRTPSSSVLQEVQEGNKFIVVENEFDAGLVPRGYTLLKMSYKGDAFRTLVPQNLLFYLANPGEGNLDDALEEITDFYGDAKDVEDNNIEEGIRSVQESNLAMSARESYRVYLINKIVKHKKGKRDEDGEPVPEFDSAELKRLGLNDDYVSQRLKAIAALALDKKASEIEEHEVADVLKHITINQHKEEVMTREEFMKVTCWAGSHYELKKEYQNSQDGVNYQIDRRHDRNHMSGVKITEEQKVGRDADMAVLQEEIEAHLSKKKVLGEHDMNLIRQYANLAYIAPANPKAQLDICPPERSEKNKISNNGSK